jgi:hypothetical protein
MNVIRHQHISVHGAGNALSEFSQVMPIETIVFLGEEADRAIIARWMMCQGRPGSDSRARRGK